MPPPVCSICRSPLEGSSRLADLCPACLLRESSTEEAAELAPTSGLEISAVRAAFPLLEVEGLLGSGGMGQVFRARQQKLDRPVALKILAPELAARPTFPERFLREARALARLDHPHVLTVYDFGEVNGLYFLLTELVSGSNLRELIRRGPIESKRALEIVDEVCSGLAYAHDQGVVHRDIKPENLLLTGDGRVKIADFGLAKLTRDRAGDPTLTRVSQVMGTPQYMAPEQIAHSKLVDERADLYSLGVVLYEMLTGELPVGRFEAPSVYASIDPRLDDLVLRALEREPDARFQSAGELRETIAALRLPGVSEARAPLVDTYHGSPDRVWQPRWVHRLPGGPATVMGAGLVVAWSWMTLLTLMSNLRNAEEWFAGAYPFAFVAWSCSRLAPDSRAAQWRDLQRLGGVLAAVTCVASLWLMISAEATSGRFLRLPAAGLLFVTHLVFDRWVRGGRIGALVAAVVPMIFATLAQAGLATWAPGRVAFFFASGTTAILAGASAAAILPEELIGSRSSEGTHSALVRALLVGLIAAAVYFHDHIF